MADRYWILGTGTWDSTTTTNWSDTSGGTGGFSVPTAADNVFFDVNSNVGITAFTVTMANSPRVCNDFTASGLDGVMTLAGSGIGLTVSGSLTFQATNFTRTYTGVTTFNATTTGKTVTTNGVTFGQSVSFDGVGGGWTLGSAISLGSQALSISNGTFDTSSSGNYAVTCGSFASSFGTRTINLNASTVSASGTDFNLGTGTGLTFNAGTSQITLSTAGPTFSGNSKTFYNVSFTSTGMFFFSMAGTNTFNNLTISGQTTVGLPQYSFSANQTINGTFTVSAGTASAYRISVFSNTFNTPRTLTCAAVSLTDVDFRDITIAGVAAPASGTRLGDAKGNSGITFTAAKTVYYGQTGSANWAATGSGSWSATSGGALDATMYPLPQDTAVFPAATYPASGSTTTINGAFFIGTIDMSLRTSNTMTLANGSNACSIFGNWINGTGITLSGTGLLFFYGQTTQQITSSAKTFTQPITINSVGGTFQLQDALITGTGVATTLTNGTLDLNGQTLTVGTAFTTATGTKNLTFNAGTLVCPAATTTAFNNAAPTNFTTTAGTGTGTISMTAATAKTFQGGGSTFNCTLNQGGAGALTITGSNTFSNITNTTQPASVLFTAGTTSTFTSFSLSGTAGNLITIGSVTAASHTLSKASGTVSVSFCSISRSSATGGATWQALTSNGNIDGGNNTGWSFVGVIYAAVIAEAATATDAFLSQAAFLSVLAETATATDSPSVAASTFNAPIAETATATDSDVGNLLFLASIAETATATDSDAGSLSFLVSIAETATATDAVSPPGSIYNAPIAETATATDSVIGLADFYAALSEATTATDSGVGFISFPVSIAETATATDSVISFADFYAVLAETATATDSPLVAPSTFNAPVAETATATDAVSPPGSIYNAPVSETVTISDLVLGAYLWNPVDDNQTANWQNVSNTNAPGWNSVNNTQSPSWTDVQTY